MMTIRPALAAAALVLAGCVSQTSLETRIPTDAAVVDARRRAEVHTALAGEYYQRGNLAVALQETRLAIKDDPGFVPAHNVQGLVFMELREDALARESFDRALRLDPNNSEVLNNYGWFLCLRGEKERALDLLRRASSDPLYPTPEKAYLSMGLCQKRLGNAREAEENLRRAVLIRPDLIGALYNLAELSFARGAAKEAENYLVRYMGVANPTVEALVLGVKVARITGERELEQSYLQQLRRRFPDAPQAREVLQGTK